MSEKNFSSSRWFILRDGSQAGPFTEEQVRSWVKSGHLKASDKLWQTDWHEWKTVHDVLNSRLKSSPPPVFAQSAKPSPFALREDLYEAKNAGQHGGSITLPIVLVLWGGVSAGIVGLLDFFRPLTEEFLGLNSVGVYFFVGLFGSPLSYVLSLQNVSDNWCKRLKVAVLVFSLMVVTGAIPLVWSLFDQEVAKRGVFAKLPSASALQELMLKKIGSDAAATRETASRIEKKIEDLPIDTNDDPRKELTKLGVRWTTDGFEEALHHADLRALALFMRGGYKPAPLSMIIPLKQAWNPDVQKLLMNFPKQLPNICPSGELIYYRYYGNLTEILSAHNENTKFFFSMCDPAAFKKYYRAQLRPETRVTEYKNCVAEITAQYKDNKLPLQKPEEREEIVVGVDYTRLFDAAFILAEQKGIPIDKIERLEKIRKQYRSGSVAYIFEVGRDLLEIKRGCQLAFDSVDDFVLSENEKYRKYLALSPR